MIILSILFSSVVHEIEHSPPIHNPGDTFKCVAIDDGLNNRTDCLMEDFTIVRLKHRDPQALRGDEISGGIVNVAWTSNGWLAQGSMIQTLYPIDWILRIQ
jgi:hypothetical protein